MLLIMEIGEFIIIIISCDLSAEKTEIHSKRVHENRSVIACESCDKAQEKGPDTGVNENIY